MKFTLHLVAIPDSLINEAVKTWTRPLWGIQRPGRQKMCGVYLSSWDIYVCIYQVSMGYLCPVSCFIVSLCHFSNYYFCCPTSTCPSGLFSIHPSFNYIYMGHTESIYNAQNLVLILLFHYFEKWASPGIF